MNVKTGDQSMENHELTDLMEKVSSYIREHLRYGIRFSAASTSAEKDDDFRSTLHSIIKNETDVSPKKLDRFVQPGFVETLVQYMNKKNIMTPQIYRDAGMDRRLFSKIISDRTISPRKIPVSRCASV